MKIYLDNNASTAIDPEVIKEMEPYIKENYGNPSSGHWLGKKGKKAIEASRKRVADLIGAKPSEIIFTSGGSESNNFALKGIIEANPRKRHIITTKIEHSAIIKPCEFLEKKGASVTFTSVDEYGRVNPKDIEEAITDETVLVSVMHANNETGTIQPLAEVSKICKKKAVYFHTDAAQSIGKIPVNVNELGVDLLSIAGHKFHAPKGVGALYIREGVKLEPLIHGASHEFGKRAGTENTAGIVGLGKASLIATKEMGKYNKKIIYLRNLLHKRLEQIADIKLNGHPTKRLPNTLNISFVGIDSTELLRKLKNIALSTGSACHDSIKEPSVVLTAMGVSSKMALGAVRFSLGKFNTKEEIIYTVKEIKKVLRKNKQLI